MDLHEIFSIGPQWAIDDSVPITIPIPIPTPTPTPTPIPIPIPIPIPGPGEHGELQVSKPGISEHLCCL